MSKLNHIKKGNNLQVYIPLDSSQILIEKCNEFVLHQKAQMLTSSHSFPQPWRRMLFSTTKSWKYHY